MFSRKKRRNLNITCCQVMLIILTLLVPCIVAAGEPTDRIKAVTDRLLAIISSPEGNTPEDWKARKRMIRETVDQVFDWEAFSRRALANYWSQMSSEEKKEFVHLFSQLIEQTYIDKTKQYSGEKVLFLGERIDGKYGEVHTKVVTKDGREIKVDYRVFKKAEGWYVYDIYVEGVSFVNNYRVQFNNIITRSSYEGLIKRLKEKLVSE